MNECGHKNTLGGVMCTFLPENGKEDMYHIDKGVVYCDH